MLPPKYLHAFSRYTISSKLSVIVMLFIASTIWCYFILEELYQSEIRQLVERKVGLEKINKEGNLLYSIVIYDLLMLKDHTQNNDKLIPHEQLSEWETRLNIILEDMESNNKSDTILWRDFLKKKSQSNTTINQLMLESDYRSGFSLYALPSVSNGSKFSQDNQTLFALKRAPIVYFAYIESLKNSNQSEDLSAQNVQLWYNKFKETIQNTHNPRFAFALQNAINSGVEVIKLIKNPPNDPLSEVAQPLFLHLQLLQKAWNELLEGMSAETQDFLWSAIEMHWFSILFPAFLAVVGLLILYMFYLEFGPPLQELGIALKMLRSGDSSASVKTIYPDFIGELGTNFNYIAQEFKKIRAKERAESAQLFSVQNNLEELSRVYESSIAEQQRHIRELAAKLDLLLSSMSHLSVTLQEIGSNSMQTTKSAYTSQTALETIHRLLHEVQESSLVMTSKLSLLNEKAQLISHSVAESSQVGAQMQLIALKAAIEAEKAGEHGRSFGVIAREVRTFADQIAQSMQTIKQATEETSSAIVGRIMGFEKFFQDLQSGLNEVQGIVDGLAQVVEKIHVQEITIENLHLGIKEHIRTSIELHQEIANISNQANLLSDATRSFAVPLHEIGETGKRLEHL